MDNPYLAYLPPSQRGASSSKTKHDTSKEPLFGFLPRKVTGKQARKALVRFIIRRIQGFI